MHRRRCFVPPSQIVEMGRRKEGRFCCGRRVSERKHFGGEGEKVVAVVRHIWWDELNHHLEIIWLSPSTLLL
jgi:hypothetical protein